MSNKYKNAPIKEGIPRSYKDTLIKEGIAETRVNSIIEGLDTLHTALTYMDNKNRKIFLSKPLILRLREYAKAAGMWEPPIQHTWRI